MKKIFFTCLFALVCGFSFGQSVSIDGFLADPVITDKATTTEVEMQIKNLTNNEIIIRLTRTRLVIDSPQQSYFCIGELCYGAAANESRTAGDTIAPNSSIKLIVYYKPKNVEGCAETDLKIYLMSNPNDYAMKTFNFKTENATCTTGILDELAANTQLLAPMPNPAHNATTIQYSLPIQVKNADLVVVDMMGRKVHTQSLSDKEGRVELAVAQWAAGIYQVMLQSENGTLASQKLQVME